LQTAWSEPALIKLACAFEHATQHRRAPRFLAADGRAQFFRDAKDQDAVAESIENLS